MCDALQYTKLLGEQECNTKGNSCSVHSNVDGHYFF
jgi:hypothetical protein